MHIRAYKSCLYIVLLLLWAACKKPDFSVTPQSQDPTTVRLYLQNNFDFSLFTAAIQKAGLADSLDNRGQSYTVFAPLNNALHKDGIYAPTDFDKWKPDSLRNFVRTHIIPGKLFYSDIPAQSDNRYTAINGQTLYVSISTVYGVGMIVNGVNVKAASSLSTTVGVTYGATELNGVVYPVQTTIKASSSTVKAFLEGRGDMTHLIAGFKKFGLWDNLEENGPVTIFAPPDSIFEQRGMTLDSIARIDTSLYDPILFNGYMLKPNHLFSLDIAQSIPAPDGSFLFFPSLSPAYATMVGGYGINVGITRWSDTYGGFGFAYVGPAGPFTGTPFLGEPQTVYQLDLAQGTYMNYSLSNGVVHLLGDLLAAPENVRK